MNLKEVPKISVIMAVYNSEKYLAEAIDSILNQTFRDFELIIINDCSKDNSLSILREYQKKDKRIILIKNKRNIKLAASLNEGLKIAKGKYIARMDADDISLPERFAIQYNFLEKNPSIFLVGTGAKIIDQNGRIKNQFFPICNEQKIAQKLPFECLFYHPTIMFRNTHKFFYRGKFICAQDYDFYLNLLSAGKTLTNLGNPLLKYRLVTDGISGSKYVSQYYLGKKAKEFYRERTLSGKDNYSSMDIQFILDSIKEIVGEKEYSKILLLGLFRVDQFQKFRQKFKENFYENMKSPLLLIYFVLSFSPFIVLNALRTLMSLAKKFT